MSGVRVYPHLFMDPLQELWNLYEGYKSPPMDKVKRKVHALDAEKRLGMGSPKKDKRRMKMDMLAYVDKDPELRAMHRQAKQGVERENRERGRKKMEEMNVVDKPELQPDPEPSTISTPQRGNEEHPVIQQRMQVDQLRQQGVPDEDAHQQVHGEVDLADAQSKADFAATLARIQQDSEKRGIRIDDSTTFMSLLARTKQQEKQDAVTPQDLKSPKDQEVPDELEMQQEECYNFDVMYLQTYGRA